MTLTREEEGTGGTPVGAPTPPPSPRRRLRLRKAAQEPAEKPKKPRSSPWSIGMVGGAIATILGGSIVAFALFLAFGSAAQHGRTQANLYDTFREELRTATAPVQAPIPLGDPVAILRIPRLGMDEVVVQGANGSSLTRGVGHRTDTVLPGQEGVSVIYGRRAAFGGPFAHLDQLSVGDQFTVVTGQGEFTYTVDNVRYSDERTELPDQVDSRLLLVTSDPAWRPGRSLLVSAALDGHAQPATAVSPMLPSEAPLAIDRAAILPTVLWAQALLVVAAIATWAWLRAIRPVVWVGIAPVLLFVSWNLFENLAALLPNTL